MKVTLEAVVATIEVRRSGHHLEATATAPEGYSWSGLHQLVESWITPAPTKADRIAIRQAMRDQVLEMGRPAPCCCEECAEEVSK